LRWLNIILFGLFTFQEFFINDGRTGWVVYFVLIVLFFCQMQFKNTKDTREKLTMHHTKQLAKGLMFGLVIAISFGGLLLFVSKNVQDVVLKSRSESGYAESIHQRVAFIPASFEMVKSNLVFGLG